MYGLLELLRCYENLLRFLRESRYFCFLDENRGGGRGWSFFRYDVILGMKFEIGINMWKRK